MKLDGTQTHISFCCLLVTSIVYFEFDILTVFVKNKMFVPNRTVNLRVLRSGVQSDPEEGGQDIVPTTKRKYY